MRIWVLAAMLLVGCNGGFSERGNRSPGEYRWLLRYDVKTLDPAAINDWTTGEVLHYLYPTIGEACDIETADNQSFALKPKERNFSNGDPLGAEDVAHTLKRCLVPEVQSGLGSLFAEQIDGEIATAGGAVQFKLKKPDVAFKEKLANRSLGVVNHKLVGLKEPIKDWKPGYGLSEWALNSAVPNWEWIITRGDQSIKFQFVGDSSNRKTMFDVDKADQAMFAAHEISAVKGHPNLTNGGPTTLVYLQFNQKKAPFDNAENRRTIAGLVQLGDLGRILDNKVIMSQGWGTLSSLGRSSGVPAPKEVKPFEFELVYADIGHANPVVEGLITQLLRKGVKAKARPMTSGGLIAANNRGDLQALFTGWQPDFSGPLNTVPYLFHSKSPENHSGYADPETDKLIDLAQNGQEPEMNISMAIKRIESNVPGVPLYVQRDLVLKRRNPPLP